MAPFGAFGQGRDHGGAGRHVDASGQGFRGEDHLDQTRLAELRSALQRGSSTGMVGSDATKQSIGMEAPGPPSPSCPVVRRQSCPDPGLFLLVDQALNAQITHGLIATAAAENEIDRGSIWPVPPSAPPRS